MKRGGLRRRARLRTKKRLERGKSELARRKRLKKRKRLKPNEERKARLEARDYGPKSVWCRGLPCEVTNQPEPSVAAHTKSRGAGGHAESVVPLDVRVEIDWHALVAAKFEDKYGRSKDDVRDAAPLYEAEWQRMCADGRARPFVERWQEENGATWTGPGALV